MADVASNNKHNNSVDFNNGDPLVIDTWLSLMMLVFEMWIFGRVQFSSLKSLKTRNAWTTVIYDGVDPYTWVRHGSSAAGSELYITVPQQNVKYSLYSS